MAHRIEVDENNYLVLVVLSLFPSDLNATWIMLVSNKNKAKCWLGLFEKVVSRAEVKIIERLCLVSESDYIV